MFKMWVCTRISKNIDQTKDTRNWINHICDGSGSSIDFFIFSSNLVLFYNQSRFITKNQEHNTKWD